MPRYSLKLRGRYSESAALRATRNLRHWTGEASAGAFLMLQPVMVRVGASIEQRSYKGALPRYRAELPLSYGTTSQVNAMVRYGGFDNPWAWFVVATLSSGLADGADFSSSLFGTGVFGASYRFSDKLTLGVWIAASNNLGESSLYIVPVPFVTYRLSERWSFSTRQANLVAAYQFLPYQEVFLGLGFNRTQYRLAESNRAHSAGVLTDTRVPIFTGFTLQLARALQVEGQFGWHAYTLIDIDNNAGEALQSIELPAGLFGELAVTLRF